MITWNAFIHYENCLLKIQTSSSLKSLTYTNSSVEPLREIRHPNGGVCHCLKQQ